MSEIEVRRDLKGPDLQQFEIGPGGEKRPLPTPAEEQAQFEREMSADPTRRQAIIDEFMAGESSNQNTTHDGEAVSSDETFRLAKAAYKLMNEFPKALLARLSPLGFEVKGMLPDGEGNGYIIYTTDREGRPFNIKMGHDDTNRAFYEHGDSMGVYLVNMVESRVVEARKRYFERLGDFEKPRIII